MLGYRAVSENTEKITFLFGAGAEGDKNFDLPSGIEFIKDIFFSNQDYLTDALSKFFTNKYYDTYKYNKSKISADLKILRLYIKQKSLNAPEYIKQYKNEIERILSHDEISEINKHYKGDDSLKLEYNKERRIDKIPKSFIRILSSKKPSETDEKYISDLFCKNSEGKYEIDYNIGFAGLLDSYFHTIINPYKYGAIKFSKIFNYYWICYFTILQNIIKLDKTYFKDYIDNDKLNIYQVISNIDVFTKHLYAFKGYKAKTDSYYGLIKNALSNNRNIKCSGILTTNYYKFADIISDNVAYLNGSLKLFEIPESFDVCDLSENDMSVANEKLFFPFIFGQSFIKPIIHKKQIDTFSKAYSILHEADFLVILGFNLNEDDNHINSMLKDFVDNGGKIIKVQHENKKDGNEKEDKSRDAHKKIRCDESAIEYCVFENYDNQKVVDEIFKKVNELMEEN